ncbi:hypothetical protein V8017_08090 [Stenotrophomonas rhizophila]
MSDQATLQARIDAILEKYPIAHLSGFWLPVEVRIDGVAYEVRIHVNFTNHCWTRSIETGDAADEVLFREQKRKGMIDERVFCLKRWNFSHQLPGLISNISHALCLPGQEKSVFYRLKPDTSKGKDAGWYICLRLDKSDSRKQITLNIRSSHYRTNKPEGTRGAPIRFWAAFWSYYKDLRTKNAWMRDGEKEKAPR